MATRLTTRTLGALRSGQWASDGGTRGAGVLAARRLASGATLFYFRYTGANGRRQALPLGEYNRGLTLAQARVRAGELATLLRTGGDPRAMLRPARPVQSRTLGDLLDAYADELEHRGKSSAKSVRDALHHDVQREWPKLWTKPLAEVTTDDLLEVVARPAAKGHLRQAEKVRAYLRAAYAAGIRASHSPSSLAALRALKINTNPAAALTPNAGANRARDRVLSLAELRAYWQRIQGPDLAVLRFHLLTGCQRVQQLARATMADVDADTRSLRLLDGKGRRTRPREHHVPLLPEASVAIEAMHGGVLGPYLFTLTAGQSGAGYSGIYKRVAAVAEAMLENDEATSLFTPGDLRRTIETRLADAGVSRDARAFLQSHGLGGVQIRHYDRHDTLPETRAALETLRRLVR